MFRVIFNSSRILHGNPFKVLKSSFTKLKNSTLAAGKVIFSKREGVLTITFNNERVRNATDTEVFDAVSEHLNSSAKDETIKIVVFTGKGEYYSSGADLNVLASMLLSNEKNALLTKANQSVKAYGAALIDFPKPVIAAVNGPAFGFQMSTLALKDFIVCADTATFQAPFSKLGVAAEGCASQLFPLMFGFSRANSMLMFAQKMTAIEALNAGFVSKVIPRSKFEKEVEEMIYGESGILKSYSYASIVAVKSLTKNDEWKRRMHRVNEVECEMLLKFWLSPEVENRVVNILRSKAQKK